MALYLHFVLIFMSVSSLAAHNLTDEEVLAFDVPNEIKEEFTYYLSGYDEDGAPIWIFNLGKWNMRKYAEAGGKEYEAMEIHVDKMFLLWKESGLNSTGKQFVGICDLDGFDIRQAGHPKTVQFILHEFIRFEEFARDGSLKQGWYVNANLLWEGIWRIASPLLGSLANSMEVYTTNKDLWIPKLLKHLPKDQLPEKYGGFPNHKPVII